jgi:hypothetical protein
MGQRGQCPTCERVISTDVESCPGCGEVHFLTIAQTHERVTCIWCQGKGFVRFLFGLFPRKCKDCMGQKMLAVTIVTDKRTGEQLKIRMNEWLVNWPYSVVRALWLGGELWWHHHVNNMDTPLRRHVKSLCDKK